MKRIGKAIILACMTLCVVFGCIFLAGTAAVLAADDGTTAQKVAVKRIEYDDLTLTIDKKGNHIIYYSKDNKTWYEVEGYGTGVEDELIMDISWASTTKAVPLYLKGDRNENVVDITLPAAQTLKMKFNKVEGTLEITTYEGTSSQLEWRKSTDYTWQTVSTAAISNSKSDFCNELEKFRTKGAKIVFRTKGIEGTSATNPGERPSKEVTVTISARPTAPSVKLNVTKMTLNTTIKMEYSNDDGNVWYDCDKAMPLMDMLTKDSKDKDETTVIKDVTLLIRKKATTSAGYSKIQTLTFAAQRNQPADNEMESYVEMNEKKTSKKFVISFPKAAKTQIYEYVVVTSPSSFDMTTAKWKSVNSSKLIKLSDKTAPEGSVIYYRLKGTAANTSKKIDAVLPSAYSKRTVSYTLTAK